MCEFFHDDPEEIDKLGVDYVLPCDCSNPDCPGKQTVYGMLVRTWKGWFLLGQTSGVWLSIDGLKHFRDQLGKPDLEIALSPGCKIIYGFEQSHAKQISEELHGPTRRNQ
jgi:hypothetical protein